MKKKRKANIKLGCSILFIIYLIVLFYFLFFSERYGRTMENTTYRYNLVPFKEIQSYIKHRSYFTFELFFVNIVGNVLAFLPFGIFMPLIFNKSRNFFLILLESILFSAAIETIQLVTKVGSFDVDDIIMNTLGGILGFIIFVIFLKKRVSEKIVPKTRNN
jgi:glycopeptide antibiotics resistance protein